MSYICCRVYLFLLAFTKTLANSQKDEEMEFYREKFAGSQADRAVKAAAEKTAEQLKKTKISGLTFLCYVITFSSSCSIYVFDDVFRLLKIKSFLSNARRWVCYHYSNVSVKPPV